MKYLSDYRDPRAAEGLLDAIRRAATRPWAVLEVCGGQAEPLLRSGTDLALPRGLELIHGPGCPVSVTPAEVIDRALELAAEPGAVVCTSADMLRVPGRRGSLDEARARGADVRAVYSALDALALARKHPGAAVTFLAVGFETTAPTAAAAVREADRLGLDNFRLLSAHRRLAPGIAAVLAAPGRARVGAVLAAGHVATVTGLGEFAALASRFRVPVVTVGPEPIDLLDGLHRAVRQLEEGTWGVDNQYARAVRPGGNPTARAAIDAVFEPADAVWPGLGRLPDSGLALREHYRRFDAAPRAAAPSEVTDTTVPPPCGDVVAGRARPTACPAFGTRCTPLRPLGAPMVAAEGACAAYFRHRRPTAAAPPAAVAAHPLHVVPASASPGGA